MKSCWFFSLKKFCNNRHNFYTNFYDAHFVVLYRNENCVCLKNENYSASIITGEVLIHERAFCTILYAQFRSSHCNSCFKVLQKNATEVCPHCKEVSQRHKKTKRDGHIILMMLLFKNKKVHGQIFIPCYFIFRLNECPGRHKPGYSLRDKTK